MIISNAPLSISEIKEKHSSFYGAMVKIVVDTGLEPIALNAEMHADLGQMLLTCVKEDIGFAAERERLECGLELIQKLLKVLRQMNSKTILLDCAP